MKPLEKKVFKLILDKALVRDKELVVVGVSGGSDSVALLHVLGALRDDLNISLHAVYVDHGLRPDETPGEAQLVREKAKELRIPVSVGKVDVPKYVKDQGISTEDAARTLRYAYLEKVAIDVGTHKIAVAHTADDQAEEVLLRLLRGTGKKGLSGMDYIREGRIIRPFLDTPKSMLLAYLAENNITYLEDSSNRDKGFLRNKVRLDLLPYLAKHFNPSVGETLRRTAAILSEEEEYLDHIADEMYQKLVREHDDKKKVISFEVEPFQQIPTAVQRRIIEKIFWQMLCRPGFLQIEQVLQLVAEGHNGRAHFSEGLRVEVKGAKVVCSYPRGKVSKRGDLANDTVQSFEYVFADPGVYQIDEIGSSLKIELLENVGIDLKKQGANGHSVDFIDGDKINFPLVVRSPQPGDRFHPLGAPGTKKVYDWLTDKKVDKSVRWQVPVLLSGNKIIGLLGHRIDHRYRVTEATRRVLKVALQPI